MRFTDNHEAVLETDKEYIDAYLDWKNDFLTVDGFASHYGWNNEQAIHVIESGNQLLLGE